HDGYISWEEYDRNQKIIAGNANMKGTMVAGSVRNGGGLLVGLLRCGHCGRKLKVHHNGLRGVARYLCNDADVNHGQRTKCIAFGNMRIDAAVSAEVLSLICVGAPYVIREIDDDRHNRGSTIVTSQLPVDHWHEAIGNPTIANAILDRLVHNAHRLTLNGDSMRKAAAKRSGLDLSPAS